MSLRIFFVFLSCFVRCATFFTNQKGDFASPSYSASNSLNSLYISFRSAAPAIISFTSIVGLLFCLRRTKCRPPTYSQPIGSRIRAFATAQPVHDEMQSVPYTYFNTFRVPYPPIRFVSSSPMHLHIESKHPMSEYICKTQNA